VSTQVANGRCWRTGASRAGREGKAYKAALYREAVGQAAVYRLPHARFVDDGSNLCARADRRGEPTPPDWPFGLFGEDSTTSIALGIGVVLSYFKSIMHGGRPILD
jgi:hypothetical protein